MLDALESRADVRKFPSARLAIACYGYCRPMASRSAVGNCCSEATLERPIVTVELEVGPLAFSGNLAPA